MPLNQRTGGITFPVVAGDLGPGRLWSVGDPVRDRMLGLFSAAITAELSAAWNAERTGTKLAAQPPVASVLHQQPRKNILREGGYRFPLLALYRAGNAPWTDFTLALRQRRQDWRLDYILGPLSLEDERALGGALSWIPVIVDAVIEARGHSAYESGALQFFPETGGLAELNLTGSEEGLAEWADDDGKLEFYAASLTLQSVEIEALDEGGDETDPPDLEGIDFALDLQETGLETLF